MNIPGMAVVFAGWDKAKKENGIVTPVKRLFPTEIMSECFGTNHF